MDTHTISGKAVKATLEGETAKVVIEVRAEDLVRGIVTLGRDLKDLEARLILVDPQTKIDI